VFRWGFSSRHWLRFRWLFLSQQGMRALPYPPVVFGSCFGDDLLVSTDSVFVDFSESTGAGSSSESTRHLWKVFRWWFLSRQQSFVDYFLVNRGCGRWRSNASPLEIVSLMFSKSTGAARASESTRHLCKVFQWLFPSRHRRRFRWLFWVNRGCKRF
jgi:hypothetical protein